MSSSIGRSLYQRRQLQLYVCKQETSQAAMSSSTFGRSLDQRRRIINTNNNAAHYGGRMASARASCSHLRSAYGSVVLINGAWSPPATPSPYALGAIHTAAAAAAAAAASAPGASTAAAATAAAATAVWDCCCCSGIDCPGSSRKRQVFFLCVRHARGGC
jgi:hypothetical protein